MGLLSFLTGSSKNKQIQSFLARNSLILDVRTPEEFRQGHINGAKNIPLQQLSAHAEKLKQQNKPVITCCRSGMRSATASSMLKSSGIECMNGGGWDSLNVLIKKIKLQK